MPSKEQVPKGHVRENSRRRKEEEAGAHRERPSECNWMHQREEAEEEAQRVTETYRLAGQSKGRALG